MKNFIFLILLTGLNLSINAQLPSYYNLATDNGIFLKGNDSKIKNETISVSFNLSSNSTYSLNFQGVNEIEFVIDGVTFNGNNVNNITFETGNSPQTLVMFVKGKGRYSYALGKQ